MDILLLGGEQQDLCRALTPQKLAKAHPAWHADMAGWGPWKTYAGLEHAWRSARPTKGRIVYIVGHCVSSLDVGWHLVERDCLSHWASVLAMSQWSGRGQLRRKWDSSAGNIFAALRIPWPPGDRPLSKDLTAMVTAYAVIRALQRMGVRAALKWPNDLLLHGKVGGVLIEERRGVLLAGIGINLVHAPQRARPEDAAPAADLSKFLPHQGPLSVWLELREGMRRCFDEELAHLTPEEIIGRINDVLAWKDENVRIVDGEKKESVLRGSFRLVEVTPEGELRLAPCGDTAEQNARTFIVGEGSLIRA